MRNWRTLLRWSGIPLCWCAATLSPLIAAEAERNTDSGLGDYYAPLVIVGEGWSQQIVINNVDEDDESLIGELRFYRQNGDPWMIDLVGRGSTDRVFVTLRPDQMMIVETVVKQDPQTLGFAVLETDCCAWHLAQTIFRKQAPGRPDLMTSMPLPQTTYGSTTIPFDNRGGKYAGVGVLNADTCYSFGCEGELLYIFRDENGSEIKRVRRTQRNSTLEWFSLSAGHPELVGRTGTLEVQTADPEDLVSLVGFSLQFAPNGAFTVVASIER